jgi:hypothetical protein
MFSIIRAVINYNHGILHIDSPKGNEEICILGNGPSLIENMKHDTKFILSRDSMCVNNFVESELFEVIRPRYYLLLDPDYWRKESLPELIELRDRIYALINLKTTWCLTILLPFNARKVLDWNNIFGSNVHTKIAYFNNTPLTGYDAILHKLFMYNLGMPPAQNVLVAGIFIAINMMYKNIYLFGADHSWHEDIVINAENVVCYKDKHFYDDKEAVLIPWQKGDNSGATWKMHEILRALSKMFEGYQSLEKYSKYRNIQIYNASNKHALMHSPDIILGKCVNDKGTPR